MYHLKIHPFFIDMGEEMNIDNEVAPNSIYILNPTLLMEVNF